MMPAQKVQNSSLWMNKYRKISVIIFALMAVLASASTSAFEASNIVVPIIIIIGALLGLGFFIIGSKQ